jgi:CRISPR-associated endonuclease/helicase Cas3
MNRPPCLWGKRDKVTGKRHPLFAHLADVASVMESILRLPVFRQRMEKALGKPLTPVLVARICVLVVLHDLGKFAPGFQLRLGNPGQGCNHIESLYWLCDQREKLFGIFPWLKIWFDSANTMYVWLLTAFSHHGTTFTGAEPHAPAHPREFWKPLPGGLDPWKEMEGLNALLPQWFPLAFIASAEEEDALLLSPPAQHLFAGLLMLADWIGSDERFFPYCGQEGRDGPEANPMPFARRAAGEALKIIGLDVGTARPFSLPSFVEQFPHAPAPRPLQAAVDALPLPAPGEGSLTLVEAETGSGKTEAALRHFTRLFAAGAVDSLYFANPLRFAARELHGRVSEFAGHTFGGALPTVLAIPGYIRMDDKEGRLLPEYLLPEYRVVWEDAAGYMAGRGWAAEHAKRFLCAPLGVGTIDQALLAALRVPHAHLRAAALQRSLLVVDEAHASDAYMTMITCAVLQWFRQVGGHVLIMSATLGAWAWEWYMAAWRGEFFRNAAVPSRQEAEAVPYPRIMAVPASAAPILAPPVASSGGQKEVRVRCRPLMGDPSGVAQLARTYVEQGACVLILRNTVRLARHTLAALEKVLPPEALFQVNGIPVPHHSRYAAEDRQSLDRRVSDCFGKDMPRPSVVLVATQTLEQSLDVDFDVLITDLCPADVLLQRIGRLHRHERGQRAVDEALCHVLTPDGPEEWLLSPEARRFGFGPDRAYEDVVGVLSTWRMAREDEVWRLPRDNRRLVEGATHVAYLLELAQSLGPQWEKATGALLGQTAAQRNMAHHNCLCWTERFADPNNIINKDITGSIGTRLGMADRLIHFAESACGPLGNDICEVRLPGWSLPADQAGTDGVVTLSAGTEGVFQFEVRGKIFYYTATGIMTQQEWEDMCSISSQIPCSP